MTDTATPTTAPAPAAYTRLVETMERRDALIQLIEDCTASLAELVPALRPGRRVFDGAWVVGLVTGGAADPARPFTRLDFLVRIESEVSVQCRTTIRQRDLETTSITADTDAEGLTRIRRFVEDQICAFTAAYFTRG